MTDADLSRVYSHAAAGRWEDAAAALEALWPTDRANDPYGDNFVRAAEWWERFGDERATASGGFGRRG